MAQNWDIEIRTRSLNRKTLDQPIVKILKEADFKKVDNQTIAQALGPYLEYSPEAVIEKNIIQGHLITPRADALGPCVHLKERHATQFDLGFQAQNSILQGKIVGLDPSSEAYSLGLRNNDPILFLEEVFENNNRYIQVQFKQYGISKSILLKPQPSLKITLPQYELDGNMYRRDPGFCLKRFKTSAD